MNPSLLTLFLVEQFIGQVGRVFASGPGDRGFNPRSSHTKDLKMIPDTSLLNTQHYKIPIKGKVEQSRERNSALPYTSVFVAIEKRSILVALGYSLQIYLIFL